MHLFVYTGQVSWRWNDKIFSRVGVLYNLNTTITLILFQSIQNFEAEDIKYLK